MPDNAVELARLGDEPAAWVDPADLAFAFSRSSGPGGQAVNKLSTKAELRVRIEAIGGLTDRMRDRLRKLAGKRLTRDDELLFAADTMRSQLDNKQACIERLAALVAEAVNLPKPRRPTRPSRAAKERRLAEKRKRGEKKGARRPPEVEEQ